MFSNFVEAWNYLPFGRFILNTVFVAGIGTLITLVASAMSGYAFARLNFRFRGGLFVLYLSTLIVPQEVIVIPMFLVMQQLGWVNSYQALILPWAFTAFGTFLLRQFFLTIPRELEEAAKIDGCGHIRILRSIIIPISAPALAVLAVFTFISYWNSFSVAVDHRQRHRQDDRPTRSGPLPRAARPTLGAVDGSRDHLDGAHCDPRPRPAEVPCSGASPCRDWAVGEYDHEPIRRQRAESRSVSDGQGGRSTKPDEGDRRRDHQHSAHDFDRGAWRRVTGYRRSRTSPPTSDFPGLPFARPSGLSRCSGSSTPGKGDASYITGLGPELLLGALGLAVDLQREDTIPDLLAVRRILEPAATALAATRVTVVDLEQIRSLHPVQTSTTTRSATTSSSTGSSTTPSLAPRGNTAAIGAARRPRGPDRADARMAGSDAARQSSTAPWRSTRLIADALDAHDADLAYAAATVHVAGVEAWVRIPKPGWSTLAAQHVHAHGTHPRRLVEE